MNLRGSWQYIEVLLSETTGLCKKLNIIYDNITCNPQPQSKRSSTLAHDARKAVNSRSKASTVCRRQLGLAKYVYIFIFNILYCVVHHW